MLAKGDTVRLGKSGVNNAKLDISEIYVASGNERRLFQLSVLDSDYDRRLLRQRSTKL